MAECTNKTQVGCQREEGIETEMSEEALEKTSESNEGEARERGGKSEIQEKEDPFKKPSVFATPFPPSKKTRATAASVKVNQVKTESSSDKPLNTGRSVIEKGATDLVDEGSGNGASSEIKPDCTSSLENGSDSTESIQKICTDDDHEKVVSKRNTNLQELAQQAKHKLAVKTQGNAKFKPGPPLSYTEPPWGGVAETPYLFEILKNGTILDTVELNEKSFIVFGRLPNCDVPLEHPSISRYHSVVQYRRLPGDSVGEEMGFYVFDLGSTHGTFVNKNKVPPKTYIRLKVGYVLKFGGSTRLFILQGPDSDVEAESELSVTELKDLRRKQKAELERKMMGDCDDDDDEVEEEEEEGKKNKKRVKERNTADIGCFWGMAEDALVEDENEENPFATEFQEDQEAFYIKDPKKALQGFFDREGEELEYEYDAKDQGTWICRVRLPVDDATGRQLVAEVTHTGRKKEAAVQCALEGCRILDARGLLRQEAVSRKRRKKNWEEEDFYDSDDDTFLDRTGAVERKRKDRMKKAGKVEEKPDTFDSLVAKLAEVEKELAETEQKLHASRKSGSQQSSEDPLDAFMSEVRSGSALDSVTRKKLHLHACELKKEGQRLKRLVEITRPTQLPALDSGTESHRSGEPGKPKKLSLPLFGAMKGGSKFKLKTGTIGHLPPKRLDLPEQLFNMKELGPEVEEEEEEEEEMPAAEREDESREPGDTDMEMRSPSSHTTVGASGNNSPAKNAAGEEVEPDRAGKDKDIPEQQATPATPDCATVPMESGSEKVPEVVQKKKKKAFGPSRPPAALLSTKYPEDDPDYCVWVPPKDQSGDGRTHLNEKYGY
ncbi:kanadaptin-like isoform X1 [Acipenser ruthenus]|uniref:kanadaptin-like isoform X1 n=1 Tax=Acipenser ruthenus TaxID=7906 RepID=UPI0015601B0D|nr:kanadaptin-like isoform X1 [Acipenser ruthenus]